MILYTRSFFYNPDDNVYTKRAYNLSMYNEIGIPSSKKRENIMQIAKFIKQMD